MGEILTRTDRADDAMYFLGRAANDHHRPSMVELARRLESEGHLGAASHWASMATGAISPSIDLPPEDEE